MEVCFSMSTLNKKPAPNRLLRMLILVSVALFFLPDDRIHLFAFDKQPFILRKE